jgi:regulator of replication initiation timing
LVARCRKFGGRVITSEASNAIGMSSTDGEFDFTRLERVVRMLMAEQRKLRSENELLRQELNERNLVVQQLDQQVTQQASRRTDALKRLDDLIAQVEGFATLANQANQATPSAGVEQ